MAVILPVAQLTQLAINKLVQHQVSLENAQTVIASLIEADIDGAYSHGLSRLQAYCRQSLKGKVDGFAVPQATSLSNSLARIDAMNGFAFPALKLARF